MYPCHTYGGEKVINNASWEALRGKDYVRNVEMGGFVILQWAVLKMVT
jgi:hypothetical protein